MDDIVKKIQQKGKDILGDPRTFLGLQEIMEDIKKSEISYLELQQRKRELKYEFKKDSARVGREYTMHLVAGMVMNPAIYLSPKSSPLAIWILDQFFIYGIDHRDVLNCKEEACECVKDMMALLYEIDVPLDTVQETLKENSRLVGKELSEQLEALDPHKLYG